MRLEMRKAKPDDAAKIVKVWARAFDKNALNLNFYPRNTTANPSRDALLRDSPVSSDSGDEDINSSDGYVELRSPAAIAWREQGIRDSICSGDQRREHIMMVDCDAKDSKGVERVVGYVVWIMPSLQTSAPVEEKSRPVRKQSAQDDRVNYDLLAKHRQAVNDSREKLMGKERDYWELNLLCVDPAYQRRGIAMALIEEQLKLAEEHGKDVYVEATPAGLLLYLSVGFQEASQDVFRNLDIGGEYTVTHCIKKHKKIV